MTHFGVMTHLRLVSWLKKARPASVTRCELGRRSSSRDCKLDNPLTTPLVTPTLSRFSFLQAWHQDVFRLISACRSSTSVLLHTAVLCCAVLRCAVLRCAVLCCAALCCAALRCAALCCAVLCCAVLCCAVRCCAVLCCAVLCCAVLHQAWPCCDVPCHTAHAVL